MPPVDLVGANRTVLSDGDGPLPLPRIWRPESTGELLDIPAELERGRVNELAWYPRFA